MMGNMKRSSGVAREGVRGLCLLSDNLLAHRRPLSHEAAIREKGGEKRKEMERKNTVFYHRCRYIRPFSF